MNVKSLAEWFKAQKIEGLADVFVVIDEKHAVKSLINARQGVNLVVAVPSFSVPAHPDIHYYTETIYMFALYKLSDKERTEETELEMLDRCAAVMNQVILNIKEAASECCPLFTRLQGEIEGEPLYNVFGGWDGYSATVIV